MHRGTPGVMRKGFETPDKLDPGDRLVCSHGSTGHRAECRPSVDRLQLAKCARAVLECGYRRLIMGFWQCLDFTCDHDRVSHRLHAQLRGTSTFRTIGYYDKLVFLERNLGET